ncbi:MAG: SusC/RagA family TonB-linked outer membrane protein [Bacteroidales bacterium]|nr:SusC/RagA family TonB-linked outer membrane protein [Bacteroidales bacterium]
MKLSFLLMFVFMLQVSAEGYSQNARLNLSVQNKTMLEVIRTIEKQSDYRFFFSDNYEELSKKVSIEANGESLNDVMVNLLRDKSISYKLLDGNIVVLAPSKALQQQTITGTVVDVTNNEPVIGANIIVEGTTIGVVTDVNGKFSIDLPKSDAVLVISYIGYNSERVQVNGQTTLNITLVPDIKKLDEVVVIGYGTVKKSDLTGSVKGVSVSSMTDVNSLGLDQMLQGNAAGVHVTSSSGEPGSGVRIRIRGSNSINGDNSPLYVIDGFPLDNSQMGGARGMGQGGQSINPLSTIDPSDIETFQVLKDASATAIYGSRGANGVIIITTKRGKAGSTTVDFGVSMAASTIRKKIDMLNAFDFATMANGILAKTGQAAEFSNPSALKTIDWQDEIYQTALSQNYNFSVKGGNAVTKLSLTANWLDQDGILKNSNFKRGNVRINADHEISKAIRTGASFNISTSGGSLGQTNDGMGNIDLSTIGTALKYQPFEVDPADPNYKEKIILHPKEMINVTDDYDNSRVIAGAWAEIDLMAGLKFKGNFGADYSESSRDRYWPKTVKWGANNNGVASHTGTKLSSYLAEYTLTYSKKMGSHNLNGVVGYTWQIFNDTYSYQQANNFIDDGLGFWGMENGTSYLPPAYTRGESNLISWLGRVNYDFKSKYYLTVSGRYDGSSKFGANNKWALFPSAALAWKSAKSLL